MALLKRADLSKYQKHIETGNYEAALKLADKFGLDKDDVYKPQWTASDYGTEAIRNVLSRVGDSMWIVKECQDRLCPSLEAMNALLSFGLRCTDHYAYPDGGSPAGDKGSADDKAWWFRFKRLRLLQYKDRLDTFVGISNGRYSQSEYEIFRAVSLSRVAMGFAERGKTGDLILLVKRHMYSLAPDLLQLLNSIPEPLSPHTYGQLLPNIAPPKPLLPRRNADWAENEKILQAIRSHRRGLYQGETEVDLEDSTEYMVKLSKGLLWPSKAETIGWYEERAKGMDRTSGLLGNSIALLDLGIGKGLTELEAYFEDVSDLYGVVFSGNATDEEVDLRLYDWERMGKYEKFKVILDGATEDTAVERLTEQAVPYMIRNEMLDSPGVGPYRGMHDDADTFLVRWLKEKAEENKLPICAAILAHCCKEQGDSSLFTTDEELVEVVLYCIYACTRTDEWNLMAAMLARLPGREVRAKEPMTAAGGVRQPRDLRKGFMNAFRGAVGGKPNNAQLRMAQLPHDSDYSLEESRETTSYMSDALEGRLRQAEDHVEAGQLLSQYQVPKPIKMFLTSIEDINGTKQLLRILLLKFSNRELAKSDNGWASLWRDLRILQEKAFPFLDMEYLLADLCQGMLKAGKFQLAKNYLRGTGTTELRPEKAEKLVLNVAREYFYSAPDLDSSSIGKAKQCLNLLPPSPVLTAEIDLIDAITEQLPALGVTLLPVQFRQMKETMEVVKMAISAQAGTYLNIPGIMDLARLLGLNSAEDILAVEAAIARGAAATGDFELALDMCLGLIDKGYGPVWDLCAALGRGFDFIEMDLQTRQKLIGFALGHCDEDSVGELLNAWKEVDLVSLYDTFGRKMGNPPVRFADYEKDAASFSGRLHSHFEDALSSNEVGETDSWWQGGRQALSCVVAEDFQHSDRNWESFVNGKKKALGFCFIHLPWLLEVSSGNLNPLDSRPDDEIVDGWTPERTKECRNPSTQAVALILYALANNDIVANENLALRLAQEAMSNPVSKEGDAAGCGYLLNLKNTCHGAELLETEIKRRENYEEAHQALEWALSFSELQESVLDLQDPKGRRDRLIQILRHPDTYNQRVSVKDATARSYWAEFSLKAIETLRVAEESRRLRKVFPDVDVARFISRDDSYIQEKLFSHVESVKSLQEALLPKMLTIADQYNIEQWQILKRYFLAILEADWASEEEILMEISGYWAKLLAYPDRLSDTIGLYNDVVSTALDGLCKEGSGADNKFLVEKKKSLIRSLVSLNGDAASLVQAPVKVDLRELNASTTLYSLRHPVWQKLCRFAEDVQAPLQSRIFILELLEAIKSGKVPKQEFWPSSQIADDKTLISWGTWEAEGGNLDALKQQVETARDGKDNVSSSVRVLLALRSTHIISNYWPRWEVTSADLSSPEAAVIFFDRLLVGTSTIFHAKTLRTLLEEWESVFGFVHWQDVSNRDTPLDSSPKEIWAGEDTDGGWEEVDDDSWTVHELHSCWKATLQKLSELGGIREALDILDTALLHPTSVLVTESEANSLVSVVGQINASAALQISLLLPYNPAQLQGLQLLEESLSKMDARSQHREQRRRPTGKEGSARISNVAGDAVNQDLMALVLSSGLLPSVASDSTLTTLFSALCELLGHLILQVQGLQLSTAASLGEYLLSADNVPLCVVAFPFFVAGLTNSKHYGLAGALVLQGMRVHPALATWNASPIALQRFLNSQADGASLDSLKARGNRCLENQQELSHLKHLRNTVQSLTCRLEGELRSAVKTLSKDMK